MLPVLKIDVHTHILPKELPKWKAKYGYGGFIELDHHHACRARMMKDDGTFFREIESNCWDDAVRIRECDRDNVRVQVLSTVPTLFHYWAEAQHAHDSARFLNDHIAEVVQRSPTRFVGLGTLPLQDTQRSVDELERCIKDLGLRGIQVGTHVGEWNLDHEHIFPVLAAAEKLGACVFVHPWDMLGADRMKKYWLPWLVGMPAELALAMSSLIFSGVLEKLPNLRIAFAHGGGAFPGTFARIQHGYDARPDLCAIDNPHPPSDYLGRFFVDSLVHDPHTLDFIIRLFGEQSIMLGSDYPFPLGEAHPGQMIESMDHLSANTKSKLFSENAQRWLGLGGEFLVG